MVSGAKKGGRWGIFSASMRNRPFSAARAKKGPGLGLGGGAGLFAHRMLAVLQSGHSPGVMLRIHIGNVDDIHIRVFQKLLMRAVRAGDLPEGGLFPGFFRTPGRKRHHLSGIRLPQSGNEPGAMEEVLKMPQRSCMADFLSGYLFLRMPKRSSMAFC